jgi:hypothetical protein
VEKIAQCSSQTAQNVGQPTQFKNSILRKEKPIFAARVIFFQENVKS